MKASLSLHYLKAADLSTVHLRDGAAAIVDSPSGIQLHWDSLDDLYAWVDRLRERAAAAEADANERKAELQRTAALALGEVSE